MAYIDSIHSAKKGFESICGFGNTFLCNGEISQNKTVTFPNGWDNDTNLSFKVIFKEGHNCDDDSTHMTLNNIAVVVNQHGTLIPLPIHTFVESGTPVYKSLQPNTVLEMYYTDNYDGSNTPAFVVVGNPIVLSSVDYTIYANGLIKYTDIYSTTTETLTGGYWINGKPIYKKVVTASNVGTSGSFSFTPAILNVDQIVKITGMVECNSGSYNGTQYLIPKDREEIVFNRTNGIMSLNTRSTSVNGDFVYAEVEYTKTTD